MRFESVVMTVMTAAAATAVLSLPHVSAQGRRGIPGLKLALPHIPGSDAAGSETIVADADPGT